MAGLESIVLDAPFFLGLLSLLVDISPPPVGLVLAGAVALFVELIPGVGGQDVVNVLDLVVAPDGLVDVIPAQRLKRVVDVW